MCRLAPLVLVALAFLGGCVGATQDEQATLSTTTSTMSPLVPTTESTTTSPVTTATATTEVALPTTTVIPHFEDGIAETDFRDDVHIVSHHQAATFAPPTGWVSAETPIPVSIRLTNADHGEQLVKIGYSTAVADAGHSWTATATGMVDLDPGINQVPIVVAGISPPLSISVPITYLPGATTQLAVVVEADDDSITLDYGYYYWDGSFPSIGDHDPGVLEIVPVASDAYLILSDELIVEYLWFIEQRQDEMVHDEIVWDPNSEYTYYWATIHEGQLVELWRIPFG